MRLSLLSLLVPLAVVPFVACGGGGDEGAGGSSANTGSGGAGGTGGTPLPPNDVGMISVSKATIQESEPHVAATSDGRVVAAWIGVTQTQQSFIGYAFSTDGGATWLPPAKTMQPSNLVSADPVMAADDQGNVYLVWLGYEYLGPNPSNMRVNVAKAGPGETAFGMPVIAQQPGPNFYDKPWMAITQSGAIVVTHTESDQASFSHAVALSSSDGGATWKQVTLPGASARSLIYVCASPSSPRVFAAYITESIALAIAVEHSDDDGATWSKERVISGSDAVGFDDPTCVAQGDDVWVSWELGTGAPGVNSFQKMSKIRVAHSKDGGDTFDVVDAHDPGAGALFLHSALLQEASGTLDLFYYAGAKANDTMAGFRSARSTDQGATFGTSTIEHTPLTFDLSRVDLGWLGDYFGVARRDDRIHMAYVDNTKAAAHVSYRGIPVE